MWTLVKWTFALLSVLGTGRYVHKYRHVLSQIVPLTQLAIMQLRHKYKI